MERIASFSVDHRVLEPGVYVSRRDADAATGCTTTTFDLRMTAPNREPVMDTAAVHAIVPEPVLATPKVVVPAFPETARDVGETESN